MRIAFDIRMINHSGIGTYVRGLLEGFAKLNRSDLEFAFIGNADKIRRDQPAPQFSLVKFDAPIYGIREQISYPVRRLRHCDLLHFPHYNIPLRHSGGLILTIHDLNHYLFPQYLPSAIHRAYAKFFYRKAVTRANHIIAISPKTRKDLMEYLGVSEKKISIIPYGMSETFQRIEHGNELARFKCAYSLPEKYLLAVSINKPHKNYDFLIRVLARMWKSQRLDIPLVICGTRKGKRANLESLVLSLEIREKVIFLKYLSTEELQKVYSAAEALIFPSLYEGFGMPPLESMKAGTPVLASRIEPITYVVGDAALLFDPQDEKELADCVEKILSEDTFRSELIQKGYRNLQRFSWSRTAEETLSIYERVIAGSSL